MNKPRSSVVVALLGLWASLITFVSSTSVFAAEATELRWPAVSVGQHSQFSYTDPKGGITLGCNPQGTDTGLRTYGLSGQLVRNIAVTPESDTCIWRAAVDKNGDVYGYSRDHGDLLAYSGNALKWRYGTSCSPSPTVGADGNIYAAAESGRLIALSPNVTPGQAQPEKVRDVPLDVPVGCGAEFTAFKEGLWTADQARTFYFYSYGGKKLAEFSPARRPIPTSINANGLLIYGFESTVSAFDPMTNNKKWSINLSTLGRTVSIADVYATSDGGAIVQTAGATPELIKLNAYGTIVREAWNKTLPSVDGEGNEFGAIKVVPNGHGKAALVRSAKLSTTDPATKAPAVGIAVLDVANGEISYNKMLKGNLDASNGDLYGLQMTGDPVVGVDAVYVRAMCVGACSDVTTKLFPIKVPGMRLDYPRGAVLAANAPMQPSAVPYVAMGDSFSSGQGALSYDGDTVTDTNKCYKSNSAFGRILNRDPLSPLMLASFVACGGAVTDNIDVSATYSDIQRQDQALSNTTAVVSLTVGGNDIKFADVIKGCLTLQCEASIQTARQELAALPNKLARVYRDILSKTGEASGGADAQIYVMGYAPLLSSDAPDCVIGDAPFGGANRDRAITLLNDLNGVIEDAVRAVGDSRIHYVDPTGQGSSFIGHSLCTTTPYFNGIVSSDTRESFHPNAAGQKAYAELLSRYIVEK